MAKTADYKLGEFTFPRGWFLVAESSTVGKTPLNLRYFGEDVVIFRKADGVVAMLEAYCPHMGTHLGKNKTSWTVVSGDHVDGEGIRCPFHGWRFGADGKCNNIPYFDGPIPEQARVKSWPVVERYGLVFCWNDPEAQAPDLDLVDIPEWNDPQWIRWEQADHLADLPLHPIEIVDNTSDVAHLTYLHGGRISYYENEIAGPYLLQRNRIAEPLRKSEKNLGYLTDPGMTTFTQYFGPGLFTGRFYEPNVIQMLAHTPIDDGLVRTWQMSMKKSSKPVVDEEAREEARRFNHMLFHGIMEDAEIWGNKRAALRVMQLPSDGPFNQSRVWYSQFYNPRAKVPEILARVTGIHSVKGKPTAPKVAAE